ncbi:phosphatidylethanolamine-binding protein 4 isoform X2 [Stigmatopora nigra]
MTFLLLFSLFCGCTCGFSQSEASGETLSSEDASFCGGDLEVIYPELKVDQCLIVPKDDMNLRKKLTKEWSAPTILYPHAHQDREYLVVMVDPDAPSRGNSKMAHWRHWLVVNLQGSQLKNGTLQGTTVTDYASPSPPPSSGLHRYQFLLYEQQPPTEAESIGRHVKKSRRGQWDLKAFVERFLLGNPVAQVQFLTANYQD